MKTLQEIAISKGKQLLIENIQINVDNKSIKEFSTPQLYEGTDGKKFYGLALIEGMPISDFKKNKNGRNYPKDQWQTALREISKTYCLSNHPSDSGSVDNINGIWVNPRINEQKQIVEADLVIADNEKGRTMLFCAKNGLLEVSTSSFGNLKEDGTVYDLEVERLGDHVINRSNPSAIINQDVKIIEHSESFEQKSTNYIKEETSFNDSNKNIIQENYDGVCMDNLKTYDKAARNQIREQLYSAIKSDNLTEAISKISKYEIPEDMIQEKEDAVFKLQTKLSEKIGKDLKEISELKGINKELTEEVEKLNVVITESKQTIDKMNELFKLPEGFESQAELFENYSKLYEDMTKVKELFENETLKEREIESLNDVILLAESAEIMDKKIGELVGVVRTLQNEKQEEDSDIFKEDLEKAETRIKVYEDLLENTYKHVFEKEEEEDDDKKDEEDDKKDDDKKDDKEKKEESYEYTGAKKLYEGSYGILGDEFVKVEDAPVLQENKKVKISNFYNEVVKQKPGISAFKETILKLDSIEEAVKLVSAYDSSQTKNESVVLTEQKNDLSDRERRAKAYGGGEDLYR